MKKIKQFFSGIKKEMIRVRWPKKKEMLKYSFAVIASIVVFALFFTISDVVIALIRNWMEGL